MDVSIENLESKNEEELRELIENAQKALDRLRAKRARNTLKEVRRLAEEVGFEVTFTKVGKRGGIRESVKALRGKVAPKYRNPENPDEVWSGRGRQPKWLQRALGQGRSLSNFTIPAGNDAG